MIADARTLRERRLPVPEIARKLVIPTGKNDGRNPSLASVYRILAETATDDTAHEQYARMTPGAAPV